MKGQIGGGSKGRGERGKISATLNINDRKRKQRCREWGPNMLNKEMERLQHPGKETEEMWEVLTTMTTAMGPAKLQISLSWMEIQQKSGFPKPSGSKPTDNPVQKEGRRSAEQCIMFYIPSQYTFHILVGQCKPPFSFDLLSFWCNHEQERYKQNSPVVLLLKRLLYPRRLISMTKFESLWSVRLAAD